MEFTQSHVDDSLSTSVCWMLIPTTIFGFFTAMEDGLRKFWEGLTRMSESNPDGKFSIDMMYWRGDV